MILTGNRIKEEVRIGNIEIEPFDNIQVNNNSYTVKLGRKLLIYTTDCLDTAKKNDTIEINIPDEGVLMEKGKFYLGHIAEYVGSDCFVPILHGLPEVSMMGLFIHVTANLIDIGNHCNFSLQMIPTENMIVYPGMDIAQISFWKVSGKIRLYKGKYKGVKGPAASQSYKHAENKIL